MLATMHVNTTCLHRAYRLSVYGMSTGRGACDHLACELQEGRSLTLGAHQVSRAL